jgi:hypothetical protein
MLNQLSHGLNLVAWAALALGFACAAYIVVDEFRHKQMMRVMYLVWPITALYMGPFAVMAYRRALARMSRAMGAMQMEAPAASAASYPANVWLIRKGWKEVMA